MKKFIWDKKYETGNRFIDSEHMILFEIANELAETDFSTPHDFKVKYLELIEYANLHFATEERIMKSIGYVNLDIHHKIHQGILSEMKSLVRTKASLVSIHHNLVSLVTKWIITHIIQEDMAYKPVYLQWQKKIIGL